MEKKRSEISYFAQYIGFGAFVSVVRLLPLNISMLLGKSIACVFCLIDRKHRKIAYENLRNAYGEELSDLQKRKIIRRCYQHLASVAIDFVKLPRIINRSNWKNHFEVEGLEFAINLIFYYGEVTGAKLSGFTERRPASFWDQPYVTRVSDLENIFINQAIYDDTKDAFILTVSAAVPGSITLTNANAGTVHAGQTSGWSQQATGNNITLSVERGTYNFVVEV